MVSETHISRDRTIDLIKTVAIWDVVLSHAAAGPFSSGVIGSVQWISSLFWASLTHASVSLFLMASGALLLRPERELTLKKLYTKNFPRLLTALFFWAICYKLVILKLTGRLTVPDLVMAVKELLLFRHEEHLYYLHIALLVYAFLPITRLIARYAGKQLLGYALALWFLLGILYPTVRIFWPFTLLGGIPVQWRINMTYASIGYTLLGYYLSVYHPRPKRSSYSLILLAGFLLTFGGTWIRSSMTGSPDGHFLEGMGVPVFLVALGAWGMCQTISLPERVWKIVIFISRASFCIYLSHIFFLQAFARWGLRAADGPILLSVPLISGLIVFCCCIVYAVLSRIPYVQRWLI